MSTPWQWLGSFFPTVENSIDPMATPIGNGTDWPVTWNRNDGDVTDDQIASMEWATKEVTFSFSGSVTLVFTDYTGGGAPNQPMTTGFSSSIVLTLTGSDWSVKEPVASDYVSGGQTYAKTGGFSTPVTLPWGPDAFIFGPEFEVSDLLGVIGSEDGNGNFQKYVKKIICDLAVSTSQPAPTAYSAVDVATSKTGGRIINGLTFGPLTTDAGAVVAFAGAGVHGWSGTAGTGAAGCSITLTSFSITVTDKFTQPADL